MSRIEKAVLFAIDIAQSNYHGYSQPRRGDRDTDCSKIVIDGLKAAGFNTGAASYTGNMLQPILAAGFKDITASVNLRNGAGLQRGDILLRPKTDTRNGHAAVFIGDGQIVQAQSDYDGVYGDSSGREIRIQLYYDSPFKYALRYPEPNTIKYQSHIQEIGWQSLVTDGAESGTTGKSLRIEAVRIFADNIQYRSHVQDYGWQMWHRSGEVSGTVGFSKRLEAIEITLDDPDHDIMYQVHIQDIGWQDWKKNGETAGTVGQSKRVEAIRIKIVAK